MKYECNFCAKVKRGVWRCGDCGMLLCDNCSKGGGSSALGVAGRVVAGFASSGATEAARAGLRKMRQKCVNCSGTNLIRM